VRPAEEALPGGRLGGAVRVGNTVRKPAGPWTPAVDALLRHLEDVGFDAAPRSLGIDDRGRHVFSYLEGETVGDPTVHPWPSWCWTDETLVQVATWLRDYHDAVASFEPPEGAMWRFAADPTERHINHNDVAPYNFVWDGRLVGVIDWDIAGPGDPRLDLAEVCLEVAPLTADAARRGADETRAIDRARLAVDVYGVEDRDGLADLIVGRFESKVHRIRSSAPSDPLFAELWEKERGFLEASLVHLERIRNDLSAALE
jgi:Phosphotransferase enzyme family